MSSETEAGGSNRWLAPAAGIVLVVLVVAANRNLLTGREIPCYRDLPTTQIPARALAARLGNARILPAASFGQPYFGNPNYVLHYPFPRSPRAIGLQLFVHLGIGLLGAYLLFARLVRAREAALLGAITFSLSGYVVSSTAFLNATTTLAWLPWLLLLALRARAAEGRARMREAVATAAVVALLAAGGEPVVAALAVALAAALAASGPDGTRRRALGTLGVGAVGGALVLSPWLLEVARASAFSLRRVRGFSWAEFAAVGFHPARFLETPFPRLFGDPAKLLSGGFWGFAVTQGNPPYLASVHLGVLPLALAVVFAVSARRKEARFFLFTGSLGLLVAATPWLPGARVLYEMARPLHVLRYPGKAFLLTTLAVAALAAFGADRLLVSGSLPRYCRRAARVLVALAVVFAGTAALAARDADGVERLLRRGWDSEWQSAPHVVLEPIARRLPMQAALTAASLLILAILLRRGASDTRGRAIFVGAAAVELLLACRGLVPSAPAEWFTKASPLVTRAAALGGRVFEMTGKDIDVVRRGLHGIAPADDVRVLALAQELQGWALAGAPHGLRYAWDTDPDGSYTLLDRMAHDVVAARSWRDRLKWLRAAGVHAVIAYDVPDETPGLVPVTGEGRVGVPTRLYAVEQPLEGVRRLSRVRGSRSVNDSVEIFEGADFDPATDGVVAGEAPGGLDIAPKDASASARVLQESPDDLTIETSGAASGLLHVDRTFTPRVEARVDGARVTVRTLDIHLIGVPVPAGRSRVDISLAP